MEKSVALTTLEIMAVDMVGAIAGLKKSDPMCDVVMQRLEAINTAIDAIDKGNNLEMSDFQVLVVNKISRMLDSGLVMRAPITDKISHNGTKYTIEMAFQTPWIKLTNETNGNILINHMIEGSCEAGTLANEILIEIGENDA